MGVSGSGKSTVGEALAQALAISFYDADDFHPPANIEKMQGGNPLNDQDRQPWLEILANKMAIWEESGGAVLACSALKESYRNTLSKVPAEKIKWIYLKGSFELIAERMQQRKGHFFSAKLLQTQFDTLEEPKGAFVVDIKMSTEKIIDLIITNQHN